MYLSTLFPNVGAFYRFFKTSLNECHYRRVCDSLRDLVPSALFLKNVKNTHDRVLL